MLAVEVLRGLVAGTVLAVCWLLGVGVWQGLEGRSAVGAGLGQCLALWVASTVFALFGHLVAL